MAPESHVGDGFGSSLSASSDCSPGILAVGGRSIFLQSFIVRMPCSDACRLMRTLPCIVLVVFD